MNKLYPIKLIPEPRERVWGGNYLVKTLKKDFLQDDRKEEKINWEEKKIGESWEIWNLYGGSSTILNGFLAENNIDDISETYMGDFMGDDIYQYYKGMFPIMVKILDINDKLSVQVHPNDQTAFDMEDSYGKAEFWYIMEAKPNSAIYMGFNKEVTPQELYDRIQNGTVEEILNKIIPKKGDCFYIQPGCVHSAGGGVIIAEITESSDITYRIYDWGREHDPKTARKMHLQEAIDIIDYKKYDDEKYHFKNITSSTAIVNTKYFIIKSILLSESLKKNHSTANSFTVYICIEGEAEIATANHIKETIGKGDTIIIPAGMDDYTLSPSRPNTLLIEVYMPQLEEDKDEYLNYPIDNDAEHGHHCNHHHHE